MEKSNSSYLKYASLEEIRKIAEVFDAHDVPAEDRCLHYVGKDGVGHVLTKGCYIDNYMYSQMPDWIKTIMLAEDADDNNSL